MSKLPVWSELIQKISPATLHETFPASLDKDTPSSVSEAEMSDAEMKERERLVTGMKKSEDDFETRYPGRGKEVMYATATKQAMAEAVQRPVRVGDSVKIAAPAPPNMGWRAGSSGASLSGSVVKINGNMVDVKLSNNRVVRAAMNKVSLQEAVQRPVRVGDYVHAGFAVKGGAGFSGRVDKVDGNWVYVNLGKDQSVRFTNDPSSNWGERIIKAPMKNVSLQEESIDSDYEAYFRGVLKKHGYDSPADIPDDKKDDFFNAVDAGYKAKNEKVFKPGQAITESILTEVEQVPLDFEYLKTFGFTKKNLVRQYRENENENRHTDNALFLTMLFGTPQEQELVSKLKRIAVRDGGIDVTKYQPLIKKVDSLHDKYYQKLLGLKESRKPTSQVISEVRAKLKLQALKEEYDDLEMMKAQLKSIVDRAQALHTYLETNPPADVEAWVQSKATDAEHGILAMHDYFLYNDEAIPSGRLAEANDTKDAMVPLRMQAATIIAKSLGAVKGSGQSVDFRSAGSRPEDIVNQSIRVWLSGSHTNEGWALGARMLKLAHQMGIKWDTALVKKKLAPITRKKLGLDTIVEADGPPTNMERVRQQQTQEKEALQQRQEREKIVAQQRDTEEKFRQQQVKKAQSVRKT